LGGQLFLLTFFLIRLRLGLPKLFNVLLTLIGVCVAQEGTLSGFCLGVTLDGLEWPYRGCYRPMAQCAGVARVREAEDALLPAIIRLRIAAVVDFVVLATVATIAVYF
jgi:hypothetical protein